MTGRLLLLPCLLLAACTPSVPTAPAEPAQLTLVSTPPTGTPGWVLDAPLEVKVIDSDGKPAVGITVTWRAEADGAQLEGSAPAPGPLKWDELNPTWSANATSISDDSGIARKQYLPGWGRGAQRVTATVGDASLIISVSVTSFMATSAAMSQSRACGLDGDGKLYCWVPSWRARQSVPIRMPAGMRPVAANTAERFLSLAGGESAPICGLTLDRALRCLVPANFDALGVATPVAVSTPVPFVQITSSASSMCGLDSSGGAWCSGSNRAGELGDGTTTNRTTFGPVTGSVRFAALVTSDGRACGVDLSGGAWCWGGSGDALGVVNSSVSIITVPTAVAVGRRYSQVAPLVGGVCGIDAITAIMECWGNAAIGRIGAPPVRDPVTPLRVVGAPHLRDFAGGANTSGQFLEVTGTVANWGDQLPFDLQLIGVPERGAGLAGFDRILTRGSGAICLAHVTGSTVCSWVYYRGAGVPVPQ
ncbi:MAG: hypothetical protein ABJC19_03640 [Gemmatimonadota bacterium]